MLQTPCHSSKGILETGSPVTVERLQKGSLTSPGDGACLVEAEDLQVVLREGSNSVAEGPGAAVRQAKRHCGVEGLEVALRMVKRYYEVVSAAY